MTIKKQNPNFVLIVNLTSPDGSVDPVALSNHAYLQIVDPLKRLPGVDDIQIFGKRRYSMRIWLDPEKLVSLGITAVDVQNAVAEQNVQVAAGKIRQSPAPEGTPFEMQVDVVGRLSDPAQFGHIVVRANAGAGSVVRLREVASIELDALQYASTAFFGEDPTVVLAIYQMAGSNALDLQQSVKDKMQELSKRFPKGIDYDMHYDTTRFVSAATHEVVITLLQALLLVVAVVFVFLQSWRTTIIPTIAIPVSLIATLIVMKMLIAAMLAAQPHSVSAANRSRQRHVFAAGTALKTVEELTADTRIAEYQPYWAARAELLAKTGAYEEARRAYEIAIGLERDSAIRCFLQRRQSDLPT